ncbi:MAG TPA: alpha/beta hydrolase [Ramlibacter sp.]|nr:alpha/beta hydrolase [Ramlibacter sp.]
MRRRDSNSTPAIPPASRAGRARLVDDLRGGVRLAVEGVVGVTRIVEGVHRGVVTLSPPLGAADGRPTRGITGFVYRTVRGTTGLVGRGLDAALAGAQVLLKPDPAGAGDGPEPAQRDALVSALNGVLGDHLERSRNPLAIPMQLRRQGRPGPRGLLLVHGLCMNEDQWTRDGHDHGQALAADLGYSPVYLRYNSGRHISSNGAELAALLETSLRDGTLPFESLAIVGHSMGGLVARSAVHQALQAGMAWPHRLRQLVFLGSPHHGAALERGGNWVHAGLGVSPYLAPFTRLSGLRSEGITDLRHGNLLEADWAGGRFALRDTRQVVPLPAGVACYAVAGTLGQAHEGGGLGDGLVTVASALGRHARPTHRLGIAPSHTWVARGVHHLDLLGSPAVYRTLLRWLAGEGAFSRSLPPAQPA